MNIQLEVQLVAKNNVTLKGLSKKTKLKLFKD